MSPTGPAWHHMNTLSHSQVLLSCTHVFHRACLASYERFARTRACPLCRSQQYQRRIISDGAEAYRTACATMIQASASGVGVSGSR